MDFCKYRKCGCDLEEYGCRWVCENMAYMLKDIEILKEIK